MTILGDVKLPKNIGNTVNLTCFVQKDGDSN